MTKPSTNHVSLTLQGVSHHLPDGSLLFSDLDERFDARHTGLVGRNGVGKSVLGRILAGVLEPSRGRCLRIGSVRHVAQQISIDSEQTVADLAGLRPLFEALHRIERGSTAQPDFDIVGDRWDIRQQLQQELAASGLAHLQLDTPANRLSGGEAMRVALCGAYLSAADLLILDEPSNHLDRGHRKTLIDRLRRFSGGIIAISHDRALLESMDCIVELSNLGLRRYGGNYTFYAQAKAQEREHAQARLDHLKAEKRREERELTQQRERLDRRQSRGARQAATANQAPILLGLQKSRSQNSAARAEARMEASRSAASQRVTQAAQRLADDAAVTLLQPEIDRQLPDTIVTLSAELAHVAPRYRHIEFSLRKGQRLGLTGPNGSGKSSVLKRLAGASSGADSRCTVSVKAAYLDQSLSLLDSEHGLLEQMLALGSALDEADLRSRLALLGLDERDLHTPVHSLSGGERLKAALAYALYTDEPAKLLLLDEPDNHLDLAAIRALESLLQQYRGALIVVSHDETFLNRIGLTHRLDAGEQGWRMSAWS
jgi:ATPase subunit of ABC transporter with duplicated ATPase domains